MTKLHNQVQVYYSEPTSKKLMAELHRLFVEETQEPFIFFLDKSFGPSVHLRFDKQHQPDRESIYKSWNVFFKENPSGEFDYKKNNSTSFLPNNSVQFLNIQENRFQDFYTLLDIDFPHHKQLLSYYINPPAAELALPLYLQLVAVFLFNHPESTQQWFNELKQTIEKQVFQLTFPEEPFSIEDGDAFYQKAKKHFSNKDDFHLIIDYIDQTYDTLRKKTPSEFSITENLNGYIASHSDSSHSTLLQYYSHHIDLKPEIKLKAIIAYDLFLNKSTN